MRNSIIATVAGTVLFGLVGMGQYCIRRSEQKNIDNIPEVVKKVNETRTMVKDYFSDDFITPGEAQDLYHMCRDVADSGILRDFNNNTTKEGYRIESELLGMRNEFSPQVNKLGVVDESGKRYNIEVRGRHVTKEVGEKFDKLLGDYVSYVQTEEYRKFFGPLGFIERLGH